jgi:hypothetical protein
LFNGLTFENCVKSCFKWFSKVFERLNPNSLVVLCQDITRHYGCCSFAFAPGQVRGQAQCNKSAHAFAVVSWGKVLFNNNQTDDECGKAIVKPRIID